VSIPGATSRGWSRRTRQVFLRFVLLLGAYLAWGGLAWMMVAVHTGSGITVSSGTGRATTITPSSTTLYQVQPEIVRAILMLLAVALGISTISVVWRVVRRSERLGVVGLIVAGLVGAAALVGMLTIGMFIVPLAALLVLLALPIAPEPKPVPTSPGSGGPGWYDDPAASAMWRYWDGRTWTDHTAPMA
jgi:Protein of unknown function (DUF2510)